MAFLQTDPQYKLRLPLELKQQLEVSAVDNNRSLNADIVARLHDSFLLDSRTSNESIKALEVLLLKSQSTRRTEVSQRFTDLLECVNDVKLGRPLKPSHIAQNIGEDYAEIVENWFTGRQEPSFRQIELIAHYLGGTTEWLQHGDTHKFPVHHVEVPELNEGVKWLLDLGRPERPTEIYFVRNQSKAGELVIVKRYGDWRCVTYTTPYHLSLENGYGGESSLANLFIVLHLLYEEFRQLKIDVKSYLLPEEKFSNFALGDMHPLKTLKRVIERPWWLDVWDNTMYPKSNYWEDWQPICEKINFIIEERGLLNK